MKIIKKIPKILFAFIPSRLYLSIKYYRNYKKFPNIKSGQTFDEKITKYILYYRHKDMPIMADKYKVREYIKSLGYSHILNELYGVYDSFDEINFKKLPDKFILRTNHASNTNIIVKDKKSINKNKIEKQLNKWMKINFYYYAREWVYKKIPRKIVCEKYLENEKIGELIDYKVACFNGEVKIIFVCSNRNSLAGLEVDTYDSTWKLCDITTRYNTSNKLHDKPKCLNEMIKIAEDISKVVPFMRVDFYVVKEKLILGELTFFPNAGLEFTSNSKSNYLLGSWLNF